MTETSTALTVEDAIVGRRCVRRFLPIPVPRETIAAILSAAARAPSGTNTQPWRVHVVSGRARDRLVGAVLAAVEAGQQSADYAYYPDEWFEPFKSRRRKVGLDLYTLLGLTRDNKAGMKAQHNRNFMLFDAPVGLFFTLDRRLNLGSWLDMGMFIQNVMLLARAHGLETCPQAAWVRYAPAVRGALGVSDDHALVCGMALGHEDRDAPENQLSTERASVEEFATFLMK